MAISGSGGWIPSNQVRLVDGHFWFCGITQNKPKSICNNDADDVVRRLLAGETVTIDVRETFTRQVRKKLYGRTNRLPG